MDGLECNEIKLSALSSQNEFFRFDAEYFNKTALRIVTNIEKIPNILIGDAFNVSKLAGFEFTEYFTPENTSSENFYIVLTSKNIQRNQLILNEYLTIDRTIADKFLKRSKLNIDDVVFSYTGEYRRALTLFENGFQLGPNVCRIRPLSKKLNSKYLSVFLNSRIGQIILDREKTLSAQPTVAMSRIRKIHIPVFNMLQKNIEQIVITCENMFQNSIELYSRAERLLLKELGLEKLSLEEENIAIKDLSQSFGETGRLDAEYYQPKYDELLTLLGKTKTAKLGDLVRITKSIEPGSEYYVEKGVPFVRVSDINRFEISEPQIKISKIAVPSIEKLYPKEDTILFSKDGSVGIAYKVEKNSEFVTSGALLHLTVRNKCCVLPDYLTLVLNSFIVKMQAERDSNGAVIQHWKPSEIEKVIVPILDMNVQKEITKEIQSSFILRQQSKHLLDFAVQAVELAIEQSEEKAMAWLDEKVKEIKNS